MAVEHSKWNSVSKYLNKIEAISHLHVSFDLTLAATKLASKHKINLATFDHIFKYWNMQGHCKCVQNWNESSFLPDDPIWSRLEVDRISSLLIYWWGIFWSSLTRNSFECLAFLSLSGLTFMRLSAFTGFTNFLAFGFSKQHVWSRELIVKFSQFK